MEPDASSTVAERWQRSDPRMVLFQPVFHFPSHQVIGRSPLRKGWREPGSCPPLALSFLGGTRAAVGHRPAGAPSVLVQGMSRGSRSAL